MTVILPIANAKKLYASLSPINFISTTGATLRRKSLYSDAFHFLILINSKFFRLTLDGNLMRHINFWILFKCFLILVSNICKFERLEALNHILQRNFIEPSQMRCM
jgi:hypothetical protein